MTFVHGHGRDHGWVRSHFRRPRRAGHAQLDLNVDLDVAVPTPRPPPDVVEEPAVGEPVVEAEDNRDTGGLADVGT